MKVEYYTTETAKQERVNFIEQNNFGGETPCMNFYLTHTRSDPSRWTVALWKIKYKNNV